MPPLTGWMDGENYVHNRHGLQSRFELALEELCLHVEERILTLACPRCGQAFVNFTGCFALTCSRLGHTHRVV